MGQEDESWLWYKRMGRLNFENIIKIRKEKINK